MAKISSFKVSKPKPITYRNDTINLIDGEVAEGDVGGVFSTFNRGGNDTFIGASGQVNMAFGEIAGDMSNGARGGDDKFLGGDDAMNLFVGEAISLSGKDTRGGNDTFHGGDALGLDGYGITLNVAFGDASGYGVSAPIDDTGVPSDVGATGVLDSLLAIGGSLLGGVGGITDGGLFNGAHGGDDKLYGGDVDGDGYAVLNLLVGDANYMGNSITPTSQCSDKGLTTEGGDDRIVGGSVLSDGYAINLLVGDAFVMDTGTEGGDDRLSGGNGNLDGYGVGGPALALNLIVGDAVLMNGEAGDDKVAGGDGALNLLLGDGYAAGPEASGGEDVLTTGENSLFLMLGDSLDGYGSTSETTGAADRFVIEENSVGAILDFRLADSDKIDLSRLLDGDDHDDDGEDCDGEGSHALSDEMVALLETIIVDDGPSLPFGITGAVLDFSLADESYGLGTGAVVLAGVTAAELEANLWQAFIL